MSLGQPDKERWLTGPNYGLGSEHESQDDAKAVCSGTGPTPANALIRQTRTPETSKSAGRRFPEIHEPAWRRSRIGFRCDCCLELAAADAEVTAALPNGAELQLGGGVLGYRVRGLDVAVQQFRSGVKSVGPDDRPKLAVDPDLPEVVRVFERLP